MKRKTTDLEIRLNENGYKLSHKTYIGKRAEKVDEYIYLKTEGLTLYQVSVDRTRTQITNHSFINRGFYIYTKESIELLKGIYDEFTEEINKIKNCEVKEND